jgi:hypothetical protein
MKRILSIAVLLALLVGCDSTTSRPELTIEEPQPLTPEQDNAWVQDWFQWGLIATIEVTQSTLLVREVQFTAVRRNSASEERDPMIVKGLVNGREIASRRVADESMIFLEGQGDTPNPKRILHISLPITKRIDFIEIQRTPESPPVVFGVRDALEAACLRKERPPFCEDT